MSYLSRSAASVITFLITSFLIAPSIACSSAHRTPKDVSPPNLTEIIQENASSSSTGVDSLNRTLNENSDVLPSADITIIRKSDAVIEEHLYNGKLYMVKVIPQVGKPYYLYDEEGTGKLTHRDDAHSLAPPRWTVFSW